jgi:hypothetical protein
VETVEPEAQRACLGAHGCDGRWAASRSRALHCASRTSWATAPESAAIQATRAMRGRWKVVVVIVVVVMVSHRLQEADQVLGPRCIAVMDLVGADASPRRGARALRCVDLAPRGGGTLTRGVACEAIAAATEREPTRIAWKARASDRALQGIDGASGSPWSETWSRRRLAPRSTSDRCVGGAGRCEHALGRLHPAQLHVERDELCTIHRGACGDPLALELPRPKTQLLQPSCAIHLAVCLHDRARRSMGPDDVHSVVPALPSRLVPGTVLRDFEHLKKRSTRPHTATSTQ